jgi:hypothetical protein
MNVEIGTVAAQFYFWEYLFQIFGIGYLQCVWVGDLGTRLKNVYGFGLQIAIFYSFALSANTPKNSKHC